jgi:hypothetical protein
VPEECVASGQVFDQAGNATGNFYQCWPKGRDKYCLQSSSNGALQDVPCNTSSN